MIKYEIPLQVVNLQGDGFHLLVEVVVYGQKYNAVLDTGASKTAFDKELIEILSAGAIEHLPNQHAIGLGTISMERYLAVLPSFSIGDFVIEDYEVPVFDLSAVKFAYEQLELPPVIGVVGGDILMDYKAVIDYNLLIMSLHKL